MQIRAFVLSLCLLASATVFAAQQSNPNPKKVLTPEQQTYQQAAKKFRDERLRLRANTNRAFDAETAREKASYCRDAATTRDANICLAHEKDATQANYNAYTDAIRALLRLEEPPFPGVAPPQRLSSELTPDQFVAEFDKTQSLWEPYRQAQCVAAFNQVRGGTAAPGVGVECELRMIRGYMRDLDDVYEGMLHR